jgi:hypothetical protein
LKCETGLYGRSPDRSACVCKLCENGDYIQDEKHVIFSCIGTGHLRHQFIHLFANISEGDIKGLFFNITQKFTYLLVQLSILLIDLSVGTYRLSSHARLGAFVIQTKQSKQRIAKAAKIQIILHVAFALVYLWVAFQSLLLVLY